MFSRQDNGCCSDRFDREGLTAGFWGITMPTAARLVAAIALALASYGVSAVLLYHVEDLQKSGGVNHFFFAFIGFIVGWQKLGPAAERGYFGAWSGGIAAAIIVYFVCALIAACHFVYRGFFYHAYDTIDELVEGWFTKTFEYALLISTWQVLVVAIFGGMLAGTFSAMAGRLWR